MLHTGFRKQVVLVVCQRNHGQGIHTVGILSGKSLFASRPPLERQDGEGALQSGGCGGGGGEAEKEKPSWNAFG